MIEVFPSGTRSQIGPCGGRRSGLRLSSTATSAFTPSSIAGLQAWYKADAGTSTTTDGVAISQWNDQSGNARHLVQATGANQPLYKAAIQNGQPVVRFDGTNDSFTAAGVSIAQPSTCFAVARATTTVLGDAAIFDGNTTRQHLYRANNANLHFYAGTDVATTSVGDTSWHSFSVIYNGASSQFWTDGVSVSTSNPGTNALASLLVGNNNPLTAPWPGDMGELLFYSGSLSTTDRQSVESYLRTRWGTP